MDRTGYLDCPISTPERSNGVPAFESLHLPEANYFRTLATFDRSQISIDLVVDHPSTHIYTQIVIASFDAHHYSLQVHV